jgi:hypothetical protein
LCLKEQAEVRDTDADRGHEVVPQPGRVGVGRMNQLDDPGAVGRQTESNGTASERHPGTELLEGRRFTAALGGGFAVIT